MNEEKQISRKKVLILVICVGIVAFIGGYFFLDETDIVDTISQENCNVLAFSIKGYLSTYIPKQPVDQEVDVSSSEDIVDGILSAQSDPDIKAVMLLIDSHGGDGVAGEEIASSLKNFDKPSVAVIRSIGASSAYWASSGANKIYASRIIDFICATRCPVSRRCTNTSYNCHTRLIKVL